MDLGSIAQVARRETPGALGLGKPGSSLAKLTIKYEKGARLRYVGKLEALFNPNAFSLAYKVEWQPKEVAQPGQGYFLTFKGSSYTPPTLSLDLFFDTYEDEQRGPGLARSLRQNLKGTPLGLFPLATPSPTSVTTYTEEIANLLRIDNNLHRPPICKLLWGKLQLFSGVLTDLTQNFTLFQPDGTPVRATLSCTFTLYRSTTLAMKALDLHSADVPKTRTARGGETLSGIAAEEYDDPSQWRLLAAANRITNPRALTPGQVLRIPKLTS